MVLLSEICHYVNELYIKQNPIYLVYVGDLHVIQGEMS